MKQNETRREGRIFARGKRGILWVAWYDGTGEHRETTGSTDPRVADKLLGKRLAAKQEGKVYRHKRGTILCGPEVHSRVLLRYRILRRPQLPPSAGVTPSPVTWMSQCRAVRGYRARFRGEQQPRRTAVRGRALELPVYLGPRIEDREGVLRVAHARLCGRGLALTVSAPPRARGSQSGLGRVLHKRPLDSREVRPCVQELVLLRSPDW